MRKDRTELYPQTIEVIKSVKRKHPDLFSVTAIPHPDRSEWDLVEAVAVDPSITGGSKGQRIRIRPFRRGSGT